MKKTILLLLSIICLYVLFSLLGSDEEDIYQQVTNYSANNNSEQSASITAEQLIVTGKDGTESSYQLPDDQFFVSIAPYINETHPCEIHSLTGCQGELPQQRFKVSVITTEGEVIIDEELQSEANGFIDLWLPRDETFTIEINRDDLTASETISSFKDDFTCITTMQLTN
ncbi:hypothetical protein SAMN04488134_101137 [Amphibacillus marinus]|uniref:Uncharacterized protein n=1 Tax=Amphibacillus marinus TaxID=872970 RepID=A0A1H8GQM5_9BACI|nr:CueP family metal-binding protein [Amphibacillus marinus]SEN46119.1 hypothetical protein SAMN04488134_101137 [Amphibacillus marinus]